MFNRPDCTCLVPEPVFVTFRTARGHFNTELCTTCVGACPDWRTRRMRAAEQATVVQLPVASPVADAA